MGGLGLNNRPVRNGEHGRHQSERAEALRDSVALHVAVIVLAGPDVTALPLHGRGDHVVDETVLVGEAGVFELLLELFEEDLLEDVLEATVVGLEDGVFSREVDRVVAVETVVERGASEIADRLVEVVLHLRDAVARGVEDLEADRLRPVIRGELHGELALAGEAEVGGAVLVTEGVTTDDDRLVPSGNQTRDVRDDDRLAEDHAAEDVADRAVGRLPHLFETELDHAGLVGGDGGALHTNTVLLDGVRCIDRDLVIGRVAVLDAEVVVLQINVQVWMDQGVLDLLPDDSCHLVAVEFYDGAFNLDFGQLHLLSTRPTCGPHPTLPVPPNYLDVKISLPAVHVRALT